MNAKISPQDRELIDKAIQARKVTKPPPMTHSPAEEFLWDPVSNKLRSRATVEEMRERDMVDGDRLPEVSAVRGLAAEGYNDGSIAKILHAKLHWIVRVRRLNGIDSGHDVKKMLLRDEIIRLREGGLTKAKIAEQLGTTPQTVSKYLKQKGC